jgi:hypothetical protein
MVAHKSRSSDEQSGVGGKASIATGSKTLQRMEEALHHFKYQIFIPDMLRGRRCSGKERSVN